MGECVRRVFGDVGCDEKCVFIGARTERGRQVMLSEHVPLDPIANRFEI